MKHVWIINTQNQTSLFYRNYSNLNLDPDLVTGLLSALDNFSKEAVNSQGIESIEMSGYRWVYHNMPELHILLIAADFSDAKSNIMKSRLQIIGKMFVEMFQITTESLSGLVKVSEFASFSQTLDLLITQWAQAEKTMGIAEIFDLLGVFQQLINQIQEIFRLNFFNEDYTNSIAEINKFRDEIQKFSDIGTDEQVQQIAFDEANGWNIITLNPMQIEPTKLKRACLLIIKHLLNILNNRLGSIVTTYEVRKRVISYIFANWQQIQNLNLIEELFRTLLE
jgi:hypothetical protein